MSMGNELVAKRYAVALFELVKEKGNLPQIEKEVELVKTLFSDNKLLEFISNPKITIEQKKALFVNHLKEKISKDVLNTLLLMIDRKRGDSIAEMARQFIVLAMEDQREAEAVVYSVTPLSEQQQETISKLIAEKIGKLHIRMKNVIQPELIGGLKIRVGNQIFDGSISGQLESLKRQLIEVHV